MPKLSVLITAHNEEDRLASCLETLSFVDEIVVVCDKCTDATEEIARRYTDKVFVGAWRLEGERRNTAISYCSGDWVFEIDADEHMTPELAAEIRQTIETTSFDWHEVLVDNYIGDRLVRHGWGASFGKAAYPGLFKKGVKEWGPERLHPSLKWSGKKGPMLKGRIKHYVDRNISDMIRRLDSYSTARAKDLRESGKVGSFANNLRRLFSRFFKCYVSRKGYKEGGYGFLIALFAGMYPLLSYLKATLEKE
ncbi:alpha-L-glycero-D-manno-heptose beta-1,4-glucosyltransferase [Terasakiella brassicae]|uniref:Alpha-L-glycero-D-manno-heptose beta-1,4-glucosyltransferase n=1 Tax=Terasakiella brassicae TaxID=1634917 RepID=A0A917F9J9_9PROT|nr:glycosyltransferase family 2 protein [Terasakiella brassicae]GGF58482.1 alpha-L-glycero-D-manno-heptose beta-1,4-glucosyltransferase [Terasakiella brassicae]